MQDYLNTTSPAIIPDAELVAASRQGDREAFGRVVERYQRLLCSLAFSATGRLGASEDLAQDTFVDAWRQLGALREPEKLRPWLCGILRHKIARLRRSEGREPLHQAETLDHAEEIPSADEPAPDRAMDLEEQSILWRALERVPELYREPLVLYYRENRSLEHVAAALDLTEDTVKQRLSRGRRILQERVLSFVEGALSRSGPGRVFTIGVLAALPALAPSAKAAGMAYAATQGGWIAKGTGLAAIIGSASGLVSTVLALRAHLDQARTPRERRAVVKITTALCSVVFAWLVFLYATREAAMRSPDYRFELAWLGQGLVLALVVGWHVGIVRIMTHMRRVRSEERERHPNSFREPRDRAGSPAGEFRSRWSLFGYPLVHIRFASPGVNDGPVRAWVAFGDRAYGLLFAWGGLAIAPVSVGAVAIGFLAVGTLSWGFIALGTIGVGFIAVGCAAVGVHAGGWLSALGWETARGSGFAIARIAAEGPVAFAAHVNDAVARRIFTDPNDGWVQTLIFSAIAVLAIVPVACYARAVRRRLGRRPARERAGELA